MKNIVLCGSMKVKDEIIRIQGELEKRGWNVLLPKECMEGLPKVIASRRHFERIVDEKNPYILIVNATKKGIENYIGPNSFAEIAFAFFYNKKVYVLNDYYEPYLDELEGWGVIPLKGDIDKIQQDKVDKKKKM